MEEKEIMQFKTTEEIKVPEKLIDQVIGQDKAVEIIKKAVKQRRHVLLIGEPGTGKSMLAQAMAELLPTTNLEDILVFPNNENKYEPIIKTVPAGEGEKIVKSYLEKRNQAERFIDFLFKMLFIAVFLITFFYTIFMKNPLVLFGGIIASVFLLIGRSYIRVKNEILVPKLLVNNAGRKTAPFVDATGLHAGALFGDCRHDPYQCFREGNFIFLFKDEKIVPVEIKKFVEDILKKNTHKILRKKDNEILIEATYVDEPIYILGFKNGKVRPVRVLSVNKRVGIQEILNLNSNDVWISVTPEHMIFTKELKKMEAEKINSDIFFRVFDNITILTEDDFIKSKTIGHDVVNDLKALKLLPLKLSDRRLKTIARILGAMFSKKGYISKKMERLYYISSEDAITIFIRDLQELFRNFSYKIKKISSSSKEMYVFETTDKRMIGFFVALGVPVGKKRDSIIKIPNWIFIRRDLLLSFLDGWISSDSSISKYVKFKNYHKFKNTVEISLISLINRYRKTINEIKKFVKYLRLLGVNAKVKINRYKNLGYRIRILISNKNIIKLFNLLEMRYSPTKKEELFDFGYERDAKQVTLLLRKHNSFYKIKEFVHETYNITTETGNLIVNGVLVKNSGGLETPPHELVEAGAIHKAHRGVLFIDEIGNLTYEEQIKLLTILQEKKFSITGQSERSFGSLIRTSPAPCDFILVAAGNPETIRKLHPALRDRIKGYGYEVYMKSEMDDTYENRNKLVQFVAQEVKKDGNIPHFTRDAVLEIIKEARRRAGKKGKLTLKLRDLGGLVRIAGDIAKSEGSRYVEARHVIKAKEIAKSLEEQMIDKYLELRKEYLIIKTSGEEVGRVNGLAVVDNYTGIVLPIVAEVVPAQSKNEGKIIATGKLGEIAKESVLNVSALIKKFTGKDISNYDIHVQFLQTYEGVEGDSASIAIATAVISALENIPIRQDTAMTGSLSIRGEVLPVGGINLKLEAALKAGIRRVIIPEGNIKDVFAELKKKLEVIPVKNLLEALSNVLVDSKRKKEILQRTESFAV